MIHPVITLVWFVLRCWTSQISKIAVVKHHQACPAGRCLWRIGNCVRWCCFTHPRSGWCHCVGGYGGKELVSLCAFWCGAVTGNVCHSVDFRLTSGGQSKFNHWQMASLRNRMVLFWVCSWPLPSGSASSHWTLIMPHYDNCNTTKLMSKINISK